MLRLIEENEVVETEFTSALDELVREGARMMLESALAEEVAILSGIKPKSMKWNTGSSRVTVKQKSER